MIGTIFNVIAIVIGTTVGMILKSKLRYCHWVAKAVEEGPALAGNVGGRRRFRGDALLELLNPSPHVVSVRRTRP